MKASSEVAMKPVEVAASGPWCGGLVAVESLDPGVQDLYAAWCDKMPMAEQKAIENFASR